MACSSLVLNKSHVDQKKFQVDHWWSVWTTLRITALDQGKMQTEPCLRTQDKILERSTK